MANRDGMSMAALLFPGRPDAGADFDGMSFGSSHHRRSSRPIDGQRMALAVADGIALGVGALMLPLRLGVGAVVVGLVLLTARGCHTSRFAGVTTHSIGRVATTLGVPAVVVGITLDPVEAQSLLRAFVTTMLVLVPLRAVLSTATSALNTRSGARRRTLIVGAGAVGQRMADHLLRNRGLGADPVGFLDRIVDDNLPLPILGDVTELADVVTAIGATQVIIAYGQVPEEETVAVMRSAQMLDVDVWVVPRFFELGLNGPRSEDDELWGIPLTRAPRTVLRTREWRMKRLFDVVVSGLALVVLAPVFLVIAVAVKSSSRGPVFFKQQRVAQNGKLIEILKFRTLLENDDSATKWSVTDDARVTRVGRILRPLSLDELPQLINVLRGDMSLVGPRPERPFFVAEFSSTVARYGDRHRVPVGMTGLSQVKGLRGDTSIEDRSVFDNLYIENWSLWGDVVILVRTFAAIVNPPASVGGINRRRNAASKSVGEGSVDDAVPGRPRCEAAS